MLWPLARGFVNEKMRSRIKVVAAPDYSMLAEEIEPHRLLAAYGGDLDNEEVEILPLPCVFHGLRG